ncbi:hypothetical protein Tco_0388474, partial [Tanacetum coccineum]
QERIVGWGEALEDSKRLRSKLDYKIQQHSKGSSEGSGIILEVPDEPTDNSGSSRSTLSRSDDKVQDVSSDEKNKANENKADADIQSMVDVPIQQEDPVLQRTSLIDIVILMVTENSTPTPPLSPNMAHP